MKSWFIRMFRGRRLDRNPVRRPSDRAETLALIWMLMACAITAPLVAHAASARATSIGQHARATALATERRVTAITLQATPPPDDSPYGVFSSSVKVGWTAPDGRARTGQILVDDGTREGSALPVWVTPSGDVAPTPLTVGEIAEITDITAISAALAVIAAFATSWALLKYLFRRRRMAAWEAEWAAFESRNRQRW